MRLFVCRKKILRTFFFAVLVAASIVRTAQAQGNEEEFKRIFREGIELYKRANTTEEFQKVYELVQKALQMNPASDLVLYMRDEVGSELLLDMLSKGGELRETALRILELAKGAYERVRRSKEEIERIVGQLDSDRFDQVWEAVNRLINIGQLAAPNLLDHLRDERNDRMRANCIVALTKIGDEAVVPVLEALNSSNQFLRQNAAIVLGNIKDARGAAELKRVYENSADPARKQAEEALGKITGQGAGALPSAKELYVKLADDYYRSHPNVMRRMYGDYFMWKWDTQSDQLRWRQVPDFAVNEELAEEACYDALALDERYEPAYPILASVYLAQYNEGSIALEAGERKLDVGILSREDLDFLRTYLKDLDQTWIAAQSVGKKYLYEALKKALEERNALVGVSASEALLQAGHEQDLPAGSASTLGSPLVQALDDEDKRVRYAAAETLIGLTPRKKFFNMQKVIPAISDALGESAVRVVLVADDDPAVVNELVSMVRSLGTYPTEALSALEALFRAKSFPTEDLIVLNARIAGQVVFAVPQQTMGKATSETVLDSLRQDVRTRNIPVILLCEDEEDMNRRKRIYSTSVEGFVAKPVNINALRDEVEKVFANPDFQQASKLRAEKLAERAAKSLAGIDPDQTVFPYLNAMDGLVRGLEDRPDSVRLPSIRALGRFANPGGLAPLSKLLANSTRNTVEVREWSALAMAEIFRRSKAAPSSDVYDVLKSAVTDPSVAIQKAVSKALGAAALTPEQRREILQVKRVHPTG